MSFGRLRHFAAEELGGVELQALTSLARKARRDVIRMTSNAGSGHLGGALSSIDIYLLLWLCANISPYSVNDPNRDRIIVSHGHTAAALYSVLGNLGFFDVENAVSNFRSERDVFEGHPNPEISGVEWASGSLGQGLSVGCGFALASRITAVQYNVFVVMGDGEQEKGQVTEARELASKYDLANMTVVVDCNQLQASGPLDKVMPQNIGEKYSASGWDVIEVDGHDFFDMYKAFRHCYHMAKKPFVVLAHTVMGKGVSFIEGNCSFHGKPLDNEEVSKALGELSYEVHSVSYCETETQPRKEPLRPVEYQVQYGCPREYDVSGLIECRTAFGNALVDLIEVNKSDSVSTAVIDCDLAASVKTAEIEDSVSGNFIQCGIQEHNAATVAAALSKAGVLTFFGEFGVFGIDETYGQHRMADLNHTSLKLICTHCGIDVGKDGKTHQCIDYISLVSNLFGYKLIIPADANQTDRVIRYIATTPGNFVVAMGRSKIPVIAREDGNVMYPRTYKFT